LSTDTESEPADVPESPKAWLRAALDERRNRVTSFRSSPPKGSAMNDAIRGVLGRRHAADTARLSRQADETPDEGEPTP
jgi:hypothetical protein